MQCPKEKNVNKRIEERRAAFSGFWIKCLMKRYTAVVKDKTKIVGQKA